MTWAVFNCGTRHSMLLVSLKALNDYVVEITWDMQASSPQAIGSYSTYPLAHWPKTLLFDYRSCVNFLFYSCRSMSCLELSAHLFIRQELRGKC